MGRGRRRRKRSGNGGGHLPALLLLLAILGGYGTWNYHRTLELEAQEVRPYRSYTDADLEALEAAYRADVEALDARYASVRGRKHRAKDQGFGQAQIDEFERVQRSSRSVRELGYRVSEQQATLDELVKERQRRANRGAAWQEFLKRAFLFRA